MKNIKLFLIGLISILLFSSINAQILPAENVQVHLELTETADDLDLEVILSDAEGTFLENQPFEIKVLIKLASTEELAKVHLKVGTTEGGDDLAGHIFNIEDTSGQSDNYTYTLESNLLLLHLGIFTGINTHFAEVKLEDIHGEISVATLYSSEGF